MVRREQWGSRASFLLACIGSAVGLGNIWRFPYLAYKSGGGAFLIPFVVMLVLCGLPLLFMELAIGQYTRKGPIGALGKLCPAFQGAGVATVVLTFWLASYYNVIIAWAMFFLFSSFYDPLPWTGCHNAWNIPEQCFDVGIAHDTSSTASGNSSSSSNLVPSTQQFFDNYILAMSSGIEEFGGLRLELLGFLALAWIVVYFCIWKSVRATGKVVYLTATVPFVLLFAFLVRGVTLEGADVGIRYFVEPRWELMLDSKVWINAAAQVFNSIGIAFGCQVAFSSYNKFHGPIFKDTLIVVLVDALTCILCGFIVFSIMGNLAHEQGKDVDSVISDGPGLVFIVFPHALAKMPLPQLWSVIFFLMLILLGIDSQFSTVEVIITSIKDSCEDWIFNRRFSHELLVLAVCSVTFLVGIPNVFEGGIYYFQIVDYYAAAISLMYIAFFECVAIVWFYGVSRLSANIKDMSGQHPNILFRICWRFISPILIMAIWIFSLTDYKEPTYNKGQYTYPGWAIALGWCITATSLVPIPLCAAINVWKVKDVEGGICKRIKKAFQSTITQCPCGCEGSYDDNFQAHGEDALTLVGQCNADINDPPVAISNGHT